MKRQERIYLDHAATTPVSKAARKEMEPYFAARFGNPSSLHSFGQEASAALDMAREKMARLVGAEFRQVIFAGSATEANNLALRGTIARIKDQGLRIKEPKIIVSAVEHESVLETARDLAREGVEIVEIPVDKNGVVDLKKLEAALDENTIFVSVMYGNNVAGTIQPIREIAKTVREFREETRKKKQETNNYQLPITNYPLVHTDAVQAFQYLDCDIKTLGVDMMTISSHKIYGPKGVGALVASGYPLNPIVTGGGQEFGFRSGTENIPAIVGFVRAAEEAIKIQAKEAKRLGKLRECLWKKIKKAVPGAVRNTPNKNTLPHILNAAFPNASKNLVARLDALGVAVSSGAACSTRSQEASYALLAMGIPEDIARRSIRFSLGRETTKKDAHKIGKIIKNALVS